MLSNVYNKVLYILETHTAQLDTHCEWSTVFRLMKQESGVSCIVFVSGPPSGLLEHNTRMCFKYELLSSLHTFIEIFTQNKSTNNTKTQ